MDVDLGATFDEVVELYEKALQAKHIALNRRYRASDATIRTFPGEVRQVLSNVLLNAMQAVPVGGSISVAIWKAHGSEPGYRIIVADSGPGIPPENMARIFEPFFTTKGEQELGLGLWVTNGIISRLGGRIKIRSGIRPGKSGTCFSIFFPTQLRARQLQR